jgi:hypothetical protein
LFDNNEKQVGEMDKEEMNQKTKDILNKLHYEDAEFFHNMALSLAIKKGIPTE